MTVFLGTLWCSIKKIEAPYIFKWEYNIALHEMQGTQASSPSKVYVSWDFSSCGRNMGYILELQRGWPFETLLSEVRTPVELRWTPQESKLGMAGQYGRFWR